MTTFRYDLINLGREVLAQLSTPVSLNFTAATSAKTLDPHAVTRTGDLLVTLFDDLDTLVATHEAFLLGPWIEAARGWAQQQTKQGIDADPDTAANDDCGENTFGIKSW